MKEKYNKYKYGSLTSEKNYPHINSYCKGYNKIAYQSSFCHHDKMSEMNKNGKMIGYLFFFFNLRGLSLQSAAPLLWFLWQRRNTVERQRQAKLLRQEQRERRHRGRWPFKGLASSCEAHFTQLESHSELTELTDIDRIGRIGVLMIQSPMRSITSWTQGFQYVPS